MMLIFNICEFNERCWFFFWWIQLFYNKKMCDWKFQFHFILPEVHQNLIFSAVLVTKFLFFLNFLTAPHTLLLSKFFERGGIEMGLIFFPSNFTYFFGLGYFFQTARWIFPGYGTATDNFIAYQIVEMNIFLIES